MSDILRLLVAVWVVAMLGRAGVGAWRHRALTWAVWRQVRARHVGGAIVLLVVVATVGVSLLEWVPPLRIGLGDLVGFTGNAVFVPLEEAAQRAGPAPTAGADWALIGLSLVFLLPLIALLPWLAFLEEEVFRAGLERAPLARELRAALVFGLVHMIMLVPLGAALAIGVAGFVYGRIYRRTYARSDGAEVPWPVLTAYRPPRRARQAADEARVADEAHRLERGGTQAWPAGVMLPVDRTPERRQAAAVLEAAAWHATFNTIVVTTLLVSIVATSV